MVDERVDIAVIGIGGEAQAGVRTRVGGSAEEASAVGRDVFGGVEPPSGSGVVGGVLEAEEIAIYKELLALSRVERGFGELGEVDGLAVDVTLYMEEAVGSSCDVTVVGREIGGDTACAGAALLLQPLDPLGTCKVDGEGEGLVGLKIVGSGESVALTVPTHDIAAVGADRVVERLGSVERTCQREQEKAQKR